MKGCFSNRKVFLIVIAGILAVSGCSASPVDTVKNGTLNIDPSVTVGGAMNGYKYFAKKEWKAFKDAQNRQIVEFRGQIDIDKYAGVTLFGTLITSDMIKRAKKNLRNPVFTCIAQFAVSKNEKSFQLKYDGVHVTGTEAQSGKKIDENISLTGMGLFMPSGISSIYKNSPFPYIASVLIDNGEK